MYTRLLSLLIMALGAVPQLLAQSATDMASTTLMIQVTHEMSPQLELQIANMGWSVERKVCSKPWVYTCTLQLPFHEKKDAEARLKALTEVVHVRHRRKAESRLRPNDTRYSEQWNLDLIEAEAAWDITTGQVTRDGHEVVVAVFDEGFEVAHPDLFGQRWINTGEIDNDNIDNDNNGYVDDVIGWAVGASASGQHTIDDHGTQVAGVMSASTDNAEGIAGVSHSAKLMFISNSERNVFEDNILEAIEYTRVQRELFNSSEGEEGAFVVALNLSLGFSNAQAAEFPMLCEAIQSLGEVGVITVNAVDNAGIDIDVVGDIPAVCPSPYLITVTSSRRDDRRVSSAAYGVVNVDLAAPGNSILTTDVDGTYRATDGTSVAAPHVAGALGLMYSAAREELLALVRSDPAQAASIVRSLLLSNVTPVPSLAEDVASQGRLNLSQAVHAVTVDDALNIWVDMTTPLGEPISIHYNQELDGLLTFEIYDMKGSLLRTWTHLARPNATEPGNAGVLDRSLPAGMYILRAILDDREKAITVIQR